MTGTPGGVSHNTVRRSTLHSGQSAQRARRRWHLGRWAANSRMCRQREGSLRCRRSCAAWRAAASTARLSAAGCVRPLLFHRAVDMLKERGLVKGGQLLAVVQSGRQPIWRAASTHIIQVRRRALRPLRPAIGRCSSTCECRRCIAPLHCTNTASREHHFLPHPPLVPPPPPRRCAPFRRTLPRTATPTKVRARPAAGRQRREASPASAQRGLRPALEALQRKHARVRASERMWSNDQCVPFTQLEKVTNDHRPKRQHHNLLSIPSQLSVYAICLYHLFVPVCAPPPFSCACCSSNPSL